MKRKKSLVAVHRVFTQVSYGLGAEVEIPFDTKAEPTVRALKFGEPEIAPLLLVAMNQTVEHPIAIFLLFAFRDEPMPTHTCGREEAADDGAILSVYGVTEPRTKGRQLGLDFFGE